VNEKQVQGTADSSRNGCFVRGIRAIITLYPFPSLNYLGLTSLG